MKYRLIIFKNVRRICHNSKLLNHWVLSQPTCGWAIE